MDKEGDHGFGRLPVIFQYAKRRAMSTVMGQSILGDPQLYIDLYNLTSELRELLRNQTFSILNVVLGTGPDAMSVEKAVALLTAGGGTGTENVLFSAAASAYVTADAANVTAYQNERAQLMRTIYRLAGVPWEADSKDAEASGSLKLKREDMNQVLASYADECEKAEYQFVELWFRFHYPDTWQQELEDAEVVIRYPDSFDTTPFVELLEQAQAALTLNMDEMSPTFAVELRRRLVAKFMPDASEETTNAITAELEKSSQQLQAPGLAQKMAQLQKMYSMPPPPPNTRSLGTQSGDTGDVAA
jgi:hypothetical protein